MWRFIKESKNYTSPVAIYTITSLFVVNNENKFQLNSDVYHINTQQKLTFHQPSSNLSLYQKGVCSSGIKSFKNLLQSIKNLSDNTKQFKSALKNYLYIHSFYYV